MIYVIYSPQIRRYLGKVKYEWVLDIEEAMIFESMSLAYEHKFNFYHFLRDLQILNFQSVEHGKIHQILES